ncbi:MAG: hypothetical protein U9Q63_01830 [Patescibacteria group bacterium]|nr:hypothetical protein [Patescibacteria group bacterium]
MKTDYQKIKIENIQINNIGSVAAVVPFKKILDTISLSKKPRFPKEADLAVFRVSLENKQTYINVQNFQGRVVSVFPGDVIIGVFGYRESTTHILGEVPKRKLGKGDKTNLLSQGGIVGDVTYIPRFMGDIVGLDLIGYLKKDNKILNLKKVGEKNVVKSKMKIPPTILVVGTSSEIGKTTVTTRIINFLTRKYSKKVSSIMMTGTGSKADALSHLSSGAVKMHSFIETGIPSSYKVSDNVFLKSIEGLFNKIVVEDKPDIIVGEMGGDYCWGKNDLILKKSEIMKSVKFIVVLINDVIAAFGTKHLFDKWGVNKPYYFANSWLRSYGGMKLRFDRLLKKELVDVKSVEAIEQFLDKVYEKHLKKTW